MELCRFVEELSNYNFKTSAYFIEYFNLVNLVGFLI